MKKDIALGGVTRVPGGAVSSDGDLCAAVDVCNDGMGLEMLERPEQLFTLKNEEDTTNHLRYTEDLLCIHEPEGEDRHYITQLVVESTVSVQSAPALRSGDDPEDTPADDEEDDDDPLEGDPGDPEEEEFTPTPAVAQDPVSQDSDSPITESTVWDEWEGYSDTTSDTTTAIAAETDTDSGGDSSTLPLNATTLSYPTTAGIYLLWHDEDGNILQIIDISDYGKVTAIQPIGNTLACNHEGATYDASLRFYLWGKDTELYKPLGSAPPFIDITFGLESTFKYYPKTPSTFKSGTSGAYKKYGGVEIDSYPYTDTVPLFWGTSLAGSWVPPYQAALSITNDESVDCNMGSFSTTDPKMDHFHSTYSIETVESPDGKTDVSGMKVDWTTMALGAYNKFIAEQTKDDKFVFPFYIRYAVELFDGSLIMHSYPVLMIPNSRGPIFALDGLYGLKADLDDATKSYEKVRLQFNGRVYGFASELHRRIKKLTADAYERLGNWKDLIRGINIYVTPPIYNYKQGGQVLGWQSMSSLDPSNNNEDPWTHYYTAGRVLDANGNVLKETPAVSSGAPAMADQEKQATSFFDCFMKNTVVPQNTIFQPYTTVGDQANRVPGYILSIPQKDELEIEDLHDNAGQFYKLASIDFNELLTIVNPTTGDESEKPVKFRKKVLTTISNQDMMQDDNFTHDTKSANVLYGYNRRLNEANVTRKLHSPLLPYTMFPAYPTYITNSSYSAFPLDWAIVVVAKNGGIKARLVRHSTSNDRYATLLPNYLFYPNTDAEEIWLKRSGSFLNATYYRVKLKEHKALNGMFWRGDFYNKHQSLDECRISSNSTSEYYDPRYSEIVTALGAQSNTNDVVDESNKIYTTATDNPFYVPFGNINIAGGGEVRALAAATQAMSSGQFGQHPMYTFTSEGVWAMTVGDTGGWATIQPVTRDVITEGTMPLSLDSTVVFLTERGLLQLAGAQIKVLSDVLQGADPLILNTPEFGLNKLAAICNATGTGNAAGDAGLIAVAKSLADNKFPEQGHLAYDYDNARIYVTPQNGSGSWVYNLKSQIWTQASTALDRQIVSYPECEAQCGGKVVKISVDRAVLGNLCTKGLVLSRPIKLADMGLLKRWREMVVRGRFKPYGVSASDPYGRTASPCVVQCALWGTRDWINSALVASSTSNRLTRWGGSPYFAHSVGLFLIAPTPSGALTPAWPYAVQVSGLDADVDAEHDNKLR